MSISSSMNAGVSGLNVNASKLATISDNIANSGTFGYKRAESDFSSLVRSSSRGAFTAGGVTVSTFRQVEAKGTIVSTSNATDLAISGRGMLPVTPVETLSAPGETPLLFTSTGSFTPDANGVLRTASGLALLGWPAATDGSIPAQPRDSVAGLEPVIVNPTQIAAEPTRTINLGANLPAAATQAGQPGDALDLSIEYFGNLGTSETLTANFVPVIPDEGYSNTWTVELSDSASATNPVAHFTISFEDTREGRGAIRSVGIPGDTPLNGESYDPETGQLNLTVEGGPLQINIGRPLSNAFLTQLSSEFAPISITKDGAPVGNLSSVEVDERGLMTAIYDTGFTRTIYQIPLADVPNLNGLRAVNDQAFALSPTSGSLYLWDAGDGPTGGLAGFSREESSADIAGELTQMIQTQRAYSSNAKVIQTVDEMLQETTNIKR
ncbi:flagellar hook protein FlgE [Rubricella aquisinus]|uniref:Flagellar hook protein FlgE n=1 Tax=Rubricella aquisinus TaxID=2028108 RepID=A0A840X025_9RHOB|nr:flagellar hook-basal body complex protein [Rubricella aquisinus]MBB5515255.1 flagellar hook protein FlgE [Rubricella aquisinus]